MQRLVKSGGVYGFWAKICRITFNIPVRVPVTLEEERQSQHLT